MDDLLHWEPLTPYMPGILCLRFRGHEVARVNERVDGRGWLSEVARQRQEWSRRPRVVAPTRATALRWAECWCAHNLARIAEELPTLRIEGGGRARLVYPARNAVPGESVQPMSVTGQKQLDFFLF